jgi:hypothetical protein
VSYPYNNLPENTEPRGRRSRGPFLFFVAGMLLLCAVSAGLALSGAFSNGGGAALAPEPSAAGPGSVVGAASAEAAQVTAQGPRKTIGGDDLVHVGEDVAPGVYRVVAPVEGELTCYWRKSKDAEGSDIIDNDLPAGGRPQVTLKSGQWFESRNCPMWQSK